MAIEPLPAALRSILRIMVFGLKLKRSAGVPVTVRVHRLIAAGNRARGGNWAAAATAYAAALELDPSLYHIWIQQGHASAESGDHDAAIRSYVRAARLRPRAGEPWLHMGHVSKRQDEKARATRYYLAAASREEVEHEATTEALRLLAAVTAPTRALIEHTGAMVGEDGSLPDVGEAAGGNLSATLSHVIGDAGNAGRLSTEGASILRQAGAIVSRLNGDQQALSQQGMSRPIVFDITDLIGHFRHHRLPTGIQRVQIEVIKRALRGFGDSAVSICCFIDGRDYWIEVTAARFLQIARLAGSGNAVGDPDWQDARSELFLRLAVDDYFALPKRAILVNLGTSWWIYDYYRMIRNAKEALGISYVPFVHDFIPIMAPEHCVRGVTEDYVSWTVGVFQHADFFLVNSQATRRDLLRVAQRLGHEVDEDNIEVVPLDADFRNGVSPDPATILDRWGLQGMPYALFVSTIESRKNHLLAFEAWAKLIAEHGSDAVPQLVCVGRNGWLNDRAFERLNALPGLREKVTIIHQVSDGELARLYQSSLLTVYPSHYEGWGLPITESLCYGRVPVIADNSSLPEAGAGFAALFRSDSATEFAQTVASIAFDEGRRLSMQRAIEQDFSPRSWEDVADQINAAIIRHGKNGHARAVDPVIDLGRYYPTHLYREPMIWHGLASGEIFRVGDGWLWPETTRCRVKPDGGELRLVMAEPVRQLRFYVRLIGLKEATTGFSLVVADREIAAGRLGKNETRWVGADLPAGLGPDIRIFLRGDRCENIEMNTGGSVKIQTASLGLLGFAFCDAADEKQRAAFIEAAAFGDVDAVNAYARPT